MNNDSGQHVSSFESALTFLKEHDIAVLSTADRDGNVHGAVVCYVVLEDDRIYIVTKSETRKAHDMFAHGQVALTVFDASSAQTVQLEGAAQLEGDRATKDRAYQAIVRPQPYKGEVHLPPVTTLHEGGFVVFRITPTDMRFTDYKQRYHDDLSARDLR